MKSEEIVITKAGKPLAKVVPLAKPATPRQPGGWEGKVRIREDLDEPLPEEVLAAFEGRK